MCVPNTWNMKTIRSRVTPFIRQGRWWRSASTWNHNIPWSFGYGEYNDIWGLRCQKAVSQSGIIIVSHRILWDAITYPCLRYLADSDTKVLISSSKWVTHMPLYLLYLPKSMKTSTRLNHNHTHIIFAYIMYHDNVYWILIRLTTMLSKKITEYVRNKNATAEMPTFLTSPWEYLLHCLIYNIWRIENICHALNIWRDSWNTVFSRFQLENLRSRLCVRENFKAT